MILSKKDLLAAEQLLEHIRTASECADIDFLGDSALDFEAEPAKPPVGSNRAAFVKKARTVLLNRRHRSRIFKQGMFGEPAWEMLLVLYVVGEIGRRHTIGSLVDAAGASLTTALRWLDFLEAEKLILRRLHPTDRRAVFIELTDKARCALDLYFSRID